MATTDTPPAPYSAAIASHKSVVKVAIPHCRGRWFPTTATRSGSDRLGTSCKRDIDSFPNAGGQTSRRTNAFGCELKETLDTAIAGSCLQLASADGLGGNTPNECQWPSARIVASASLVTKAGQNQGGDDIRQRLAGRADGANRIPVSDSSFSIANERKPLVNTKHPTEETQISHRSGPSLRMWRTEQFIIA